LMLRHSSRTTTWMRSARDWTNSSLEHRCEDTADIQAHVKLVNLATGMSISRAVARVPCFVLTPDGLACLAACRTKCPCNALTQPAAATAWCCVLLCVAAAHE
jgi:hypothetical protein